MTGSLHWVTGGTRPNELFATIQLQKKQSAPLMTDHKGAVQTFKHASGPLENDLRIRPGSPKLCVLVYRDSTLHQADADPDEEGSDDEWWTMTKQKGVGM